MADRFPENPCPGCDKHFELGDDVVAMRSLKDGTWLPDAWHRECWNAAEAKREHGFTAGPRFEMADSAEALVAWFGAPKLSTR